MTDKGKTVTLIAVHQSYFGRSLQMTGLTDSGVTVGFAFANLMHCRSPVSVFRFVSGISAVKFPCKTKEILDNGFVKG